MENRLATNQPEAPEYIPRQQWPESLYFLSIPPFLNPHPVGEKPRGMSWRLGPIRFERYISDTEPVIAGKTKNPWRIVIWERPFRTDVPTGWRQSKKKYSSLEGYVKLNSEIPYHKNWSSSARRYRNQWMQRSPEMYRVEPVGIDEFAAAYSKSTVVRTLGKEILLALQRKIHHGVPVTLRAVRESASGTLIAGIATIESPSCHASYYEAGFVTTKAPAMAMIGLMDDWFKRSQQEGITYLHLGVFWTPGEPRAWKGFSNFKAKFNPHYVRYQRELWRFVPGKLW